MLKFQFVPPGLKRYVRFGLFLSLLILVCLGISATGRNAAATPSTAQLNPNLWSDISQADIVLQGERRIIPERYRTIALDETTLKDILAAAPMEFSAAAQNTTTEIWFPMPNGTIERFRFVESPIVEPGLEARYPEIKSYVGRGIDDQTAYARFGWTYKGFHAIIFSDLHATVFIDAYSTNDTVHYISYYRSDYERSSTEPFVFHEPEAAPDGETEVSGDHGDNLAIGEQLRTYRLALASTGEYSQYHGGTKPLVLSEMVIAMNRVNGVYEQDTAVRMVLIANNDDVIFLDGTTDPYTNNSGSTMLGQNQTTLDAIIGNANYDIGHVFSTGGGGIAQLRVPCVTGSKARGVTGLTNPIGDPFYIDYVAHEMGHQYGANHTFNGNAGSCAGGNRNASTAFEPGSGTTIMAYAGICSPQNIQNNSDDHFHTHSIQEIVNYTTTGNGNNCPVITNTSNSAPTSEAGAGGFTIPINTPFILTGSATDPNGSDVLSYNWEEYDLGPAGHPNSPVGNAPIFRSFPSAPVPFRVFPQMSDIVNNTQTMGEILPSYARPLNFRLTVRDNNVNPSAGGVHWDLITFQVTDQAGPFLVTSPNTTLNWPIGALAQVTWDVANTDQAPVNCTGVDIDLSTDGGYTYPIALATNTPNDGSHHVVVPNNPGTQSRVRVMCANNIFFDISNVNFTIQAAAPFADLGISKEVEPTGPLSAGAPLTYTITVTNFGNLNATTTVVDTFPAGVVNPVCDSVPGDLNTTFTLNAATIDSIVCTAQVDANIGIDLVKMADQTEVNIGDTVTYTIIITNTSSTHTLTNVVVSDPGAANCSPALGTPITLAPQASQTYVCPNNVINGTTTNTATVTGHFAINNQASASSPQDPGSPVTDNAVSDVVVTASDSVTVIAENQLIFLPMIIKD